jgi:pyruvate-formate lyase-activating enzyme
MQDFEILEPFPSPNNKMSFLLDWELTLKCNLDCSYCGDGHDNSTKHPPVSECLTTIDFMYKYVDLYMQHRIPGLRNVVLNVYGGESLHHPNIVKVLEETHARYAQYRDRWNLSITTTTNAIVSPSKLEKIIPLIDEFTVSYHTESTDKQKDLFRKNILQIKSAGKKIKCIVLMHPQGALFDDAQRMVAWLEQHQVRLLPRQLDHQEPEKYTYKKDQVVWFDKLYNKSSYGVKVDLPKEDLDLTQTGRSCCGGKQLCGDNNFNQRHSFVNNVFTGWSCSVNWFFLFVKQVSGHIYTNRDCSMNFEGTVGPIGHLGNTGLLLDTLEKQLSTNTVPIITCAKKICYCGVCAPKAQSKDQFVEMFEKYQGVKT